MRFFCSLINQLIESDRIECIASRRASISRRGSEDEMDAVEGKEDQLLSLNVKKVFCVTCL